MQSTSVPEAHVTTIAHLRAVGDLALQRHLTAQQQHPRRSTAPYLRAALTCARELARHAKRHPAMRDAAVDLTQTVIVAATKAEAACFAAGGNSAPYLAILIAAEGLRLTLADAPTTQAAPKQQMSPLAAQPAIARKATISPPKRRHRPNKRAA